MRDASSGRSVPEERAELAPSQDGDPSPQARDERPIVIGRREHTEEPGREEIEKWRDAYRENPLIRVPIQNFASDVTEPGASVAIETDSDGEDVPTVPTDYDDEVYRGLDLDDALELWLANCYVDGWDFDASISDLLEAVIKDRRGRRGTAIVEHAYDDPRERERILALRPIKAETMTAYTREGKGIVLRPDDDPNEFESVAVQDLSDSSRDTAPKTPAGKTAALAQFDDVYGAKERDEIPFALDDVTVSPYDADTGELFGRPDSATVVDRARAVYDKLEHIDQAILNTAFANIIAKVETEDEEVAKKIRDDLDINSPETVSGTNVPVEIEEIEGSVPDAVSTIQQEIEFVLSAMPTPLYRVGFAGDINRDVTSEQREDYREDVKRERRRLESDFETVLRLKATEFLHGDAHADEELDVSPQLRLRPEEAASPLRDEEFDPEAFQTLMAGLSEAAGARGGAEVILPQREIVGTLLDMDADEILGEDTEAAMAALDEADPRVRESFVNSYAGELAEGEENHVFGPAMNTEDGFYRLDPDEVYCENEGEVFDQFDEADTDDPGRRLCPYCGEQLQDYDKNYNAHLGGVRFTNVGGDPFQSQSDLEAFLDDLAEEADGPVHIGDTEWPAEDYAIHDRPVTAEGISEDDAVDVYDRHKEAASALGGPTTAELASLTESDPVTTPDGRGVIVDVHEGKFEFQGDSYEPDTTLYVVATEEGAGVYEADELKEEDWTEDIDTGGPEDLEEAALAADYAALADPFSAEEVEALLDVGFDSWPDSWEDADIPARLIALDAWTSMEASFTGCMSEIGDARVCAAFKDEMLQWTGWR
jgi:hypothetical protein